LDEIHGVEDFGQAVDVRRETSGPFGQNLGSDILALGRYGVKLYFLFVSKHFSIDEATDFDDSVISDVNVFGMKVQVYDVFVLHLKEALADLFEVVLFYIVTDSYFRHH
jgi:hypothetical protein